MKREILTEQIFQKQSFLCVGLDTDIKMLPSGFSKDAEGMLQFNQQIIEATLPYCVSYKMNTAFYECLGKEGWEVLQKTLAMIPQTHFTIADAKRGDIGNTSAYYAKAFFETIPFHAITVNPYMGRDSVEAFLSFPDKWTILLGLTSNPGAADFELTRISETTEISEEGIHSRKLTSEYLYEKVIRESAQWGNIHNTMYVVGATRPEELHRIRKITPAHFYLVPGIGAQGGSLKEVAQAAMTEDCGLLVNASRAILYASSGKDFAKAAADVARMYRDEMKVYLGKSN